MDLITTARVGVPLGAHGILDVHGHSAVDITININPCDRYVVVTQLSVRSARKSTRLAREIMNRLVDIELREPEANRDPCIPLLKVDCPGNREVVDACISMHMQYDCSCVDTDRVKIRGDGVLHAERCFAGALVLYRPK